jgi:hypothetical protein
MALTNQGIYEILRLILRKGNHMSSDMTVAELIEKLKQFDPELKVYVVDFENGPFEATKVELTPFYNEPVGVYIQ